MVQRPIYSEDASAVAQAIIDGVGPRIVLGLPLGLGKAMHIANALYDRAAADPGLTLTIVTALTLEKPRAANELHRRFIEPVAERLFPDWPEHLYARALREGTLPPNILVREFFLLAGRWLGVPAAQQQYIAANYTHAAEYVLAQGVNVVAHLIAPEPEAKIHPGRYSLSCNPDVTPDLLEARRRGDADFMLVGQINDALPFMEGAAVVEAEAFSHILRGTVHQHVLYAPPKMPLSPADHATGIHIARLVPDGGTLQIGIGSIGDAVAHGLILRHRENDAFRAAAAALTSGRAVPVAPLDEPFREGLYGVSEMLVDSFLELIDAGIVAREVSGVLVHAAFFLGPHNFYDRLREMTPAERRRISMQPVSWVNALYGQEDEKRRARVNARFVNNAMMATLLGAIVSDGLEDGRVVSGVGGQHDFVTQSFALAGARSVIALPATREAGGRPVSNIRWSYANQTLPRHLRDIVVTEYGVADLRGKTDAQVIAAMLEIADSRFQPALLAAAKEAGKIPSGYKIPAAFRDNTPNRIERALAPARDAGLAPPFPFGTDFTDAEQRLIPALEHVRQGASSWAGSLLLALEGLRARDLSDKETACLDRMGLSRPASLAEWAYRALLRAGLRATRGA